MCPERNNIFTGNQRNDTRPNIFLNNAHANLDFLFETVKENQGVKDSTLVTR